MRYGLIALAAAGVFGVSVAVASEKVCGYDDAGQYHCIRPAPNFAQQYAPPEYDPPPPPDYGSYDEQPQYQPSEPPNPCPPYWTMQSGRCKPYRGY